MNTAPDDLTLNARLDGELPPEQAAEVDAWLLDHPEDAARARAWAADAEAIRRQFEPVLDEPVPDALARLVTQRAAAPRAVSAGFAHAANGWQRWAAAVAVFALGGAAGALVMPRWLPAATAVSARTNAVSAGTGWPQRALVAHAVYVPEVRHPVEVDVHGKTPEESRAQEQHLSRWLTKRLDVPVKLFDLRAQGFELVGGRLLPDASGPSAQLMYQAIGPAAGALPAAASGAAAPPPARVTVYLRKPDARTPAAFRYEQQGALGLFYWVEGSSAHGTPTGYALVGELPREKLLALAEAIYRQGQPVP